MCANYVHVQISMCKCVSGVYVLWVYVYVPCVNVHGIRVQISVCQ